MKKEKHPDYQEVLFVDSATGKKFVCGTTLKPEAKEKHEGKEYPVCYLPISSTSHPLFTGSQQFVDTEGRVDKFLKKYRPRKTAAMKASEEKQEEKKEEPKKEAKAAAKAEKPAAKKTTKKKAEEKPKTESKEKKTAKK